MAGRAPGAGRAGWAGRQRAAACADVDTDIGIAPATRTERVAEAGCIRLTARDRRVSPATRERVPATYAGTRASAFGSTRSRCRPAQERGGEMVKSRCTPSILPGAGTGTPAARGTPVPALPDLQVWMIDVHRRQVLYVPLGDVEPDTVLDAGHGTDRDGHLLGPTSGLPAGARESPGDCG